MTPGEVQSSLCKSFCSDLFVQEIVGGLSISTGMITDIGDRISFQVVEHDGLYRFTDDGDFLSTLDASGLDIGSGGRDQFISGILGSAGAFWDRDSYVICTPPQEGHPKPSDMLSFLTALIRVRDIR